MKKKMAFSFTFVQNALASVFLWFYLFQPHFLKVLVKTFPLVWLIIGLSLKIEKKRPNPTLLFFKTLLQAYFYVLTYSRPHFWKPEKTSDHLKS